MSDGSLIGWLHQPGFRPSTPNVVIGCKRRSAGCDLCYAPKWVARQQHYPGRDGIVAKDASGRLGWTGKILAFPERIDAMGKLTIPHMMFVTALGELFDPKVTDEFLIHLWRTMSANPQHIYVILSKLSKAMYERVSRLADRFGVLPQVWLGASVEDQKQAEIRLPWLMRTPAVIRAASCEPLLGPLNIKPWLYGLSWVIVGGESGRKDEVRPMHPAWARDVLKQAEQAGVARFFKQWGSVGPAPWVVRIPQDVLDSGDEQRIEEAKAAARKVGATHYYNDLAHLHGWNLGEAGHAPYGGERKELAPGEPNAPMRFYPGKSAGHLIDGKAIQQWPSVDGRIIEAAREVITKTVRIPASDQHEGFHSVDVTLIWECPACGGPRGEVFDTISYDGSRRLGVHGWKNPCGHVDYYSSLRREAGLVRAS